VERLEEGVWSTRRIIGSTGRSYGK